MSAMFASGRIGDLLIAFTIAEAIGLAIYHRFTGRGLAPADLAATLLSGLSLMVALRFALVDAWFGWIALCLIPALIAHLVDLRRRWTMPPR